ncbi:MAG: choice-of-anchor D domain-containing protein [Bacteroidota bacterium]
MVLRFKLFTLLCLIVQFSSAQKIYQKENVIRIKFKESISENLNPVKFSLSSNKYVQIGLASIDLLNERCGALQFKRLFSDGGKFEARRKKFGLDRWYEITFDPQKSPQIDQLLSDYAVDNFIERAEPIYAKQFDRFQGTKYGPKKVLDVTPDLTFTPADPRYNEQWHYENIGQSGGTIDADIDLSEAWDIQTGSDNVIVSVHDGGIDYDHEDLADNIWVNDLEASGSSGVDDDGNGYVDDIYGFNFVSGNGNVVPDPDGHGTHVAGTVAAVNNNNIGVAGVAGGGNGSTGIELMSCQVFTSFGGGFAESYLYAAENGAVISQNSWGYTSPGFFEQSVLDAIDYFIANAGYDELGNPTGPMQGGIVIFAAGNSDSNSDHYPGFYDPVLAVASTNHNDQKAWYSNYGTWIDISAPGGETSVSNQGVLSTLPNDSYGFFQGTSMACPHVSGVAALIVSEFGGAGFTPDQVRFRLTETTDDIDPLNPSYAGQLGTGRMNAFSSLLNDDGIAPDAIADLNYQNLFHDGVTLVWTAPSDADNTKASSYEIRYSLNPIDASNFESAELIANGLIASSAGINETYLISDLNASVTYYFAIKSRDFFGNKSEISNIVSFTTPAPPEISVSPTALSADLFSGETQTQSIRVSNSGIGDLVVSLSYSGTLATTSNYFFEGQSLHLSNPGSEGLQGTVTVSPVTLSLEDLTGINIGVTNLFEHSLITSELQARGASVSSVAFPLTLSDLEDFHVLLIDDAIVNATSAEIEIIRNWIIDGGSLSVSADNQSSMANVNALLSDTGISEVNLGFFADATITNFEPHPITEGITSLVSLGYGSYIVLSGDTEPIAYDDQSRVHTAVSRLGAGKVMAFCNEFAHDFSLPAGGDNIQFTNQAIDWLARGEAWVILPVQNGQIESGQFLEFDIIFDAANLVGGNYEGTLNVSSNDPMNPEIAVPLSLDVTGAPNLEIDEEVNFGGVFVGNDKVIALELRNTGTDLLTISAVDFNNTAFSTDLEPLDIAAGESAPFTVAFHPGSVDNYEGQLTLDSNDPSDPSITIGLIGEGLEPPEVTVDPVFLEENLLTGETIFRAITISNEGQSDLEVNITTSFSSSASSTMSSGPKVTPYDEKVTSRYSETDDNELPLIKETTKTKSIVELLADSSVIFYDNMENVGNWSHYAVVGAVDNWSLSSARSNSGATSWNVAQHAGAGSDALESPIISLPSAQEILMSFVHWYDFDDCDDITFDPDGLIVEISTDNGVNWSKIDPIDFYPFVLDDICDNPIAFEEAYAHANGAFENATFNLSDFNGEDIKVRFLAGWDCGNCASNEGWYMDDLVIYRPFSWLELDQNSLVVNPGSSISVEVELNAFGLNGGTYNAAIELSTNDPLNEQVNVPVALNVTGAPDIDLSSNSLSFENTFAGAMRFDSLEVVNIGTDDLVIAGVNSNNSDFTVSIDTTTLAPGSFTYLKVIFEPSSAGPVSGNIILESNDPDEASLSIHLAGVGSLPPVLSLNPTSLTSNLFTGETETQILTIDNSAGGSDLEFTLDIDYVTTSASWLNSVGVNKELENSSEQNQVRGDSKLYGVEYSGDHIYFGITDYGEVMPYQYTIGNEHLAVGSWYSGYTVVYRYDGVDNIYFSGYDQRSGIVPISYMEVVNTDDRLEVEVITQTSDAVLEIARYFTFLKSEKYIRVETEVRNISGLNLEEVVFKSFADWDIDADYEDDNWDIDPDQNMIYAFNSTFQSIVSAPTADYADMNGWNDYYRRETDQDALGSLSNFDGFALLHFELGDLSSGNSANVATAFASGSDLTELQNSADQALSGALSGWLSLESHDGTVPAGSSLDLPVHFDATGLNGGTYESDMVMTTNDPQNLQRVIPVTLTVTGAPDIEVSKAVIEFGEIFIEAEKLDSIFIKNSGTDALNISSVSNSNAAFEITSGPLILEVGESTVLHVNFRPTSSGMVSDQIVLVSNDPDEGQLVIDLNGIGVEPPIITVAPNRIFSNLFVGESESVSLTISNNGAHNLSYSIPEALQGASSVDVLIHQSFKGLDQPEDKSLTVEGSIIQQRAYGNSNLPKLSAKQNMSDLLESLDVNFSNITNLLPNRYDFFDGETGTSISDGGNDMYDGGNYLSTDLGGVIEYTNGQIFTSPYFENEAYFTVKYPGLFIMAAHIETVSSFFIDGNLGADGFGSMDASVIALTHGGKSYLGFVKRVYDAFDPSVNHLIIVEDNGSAYHEFDTSTDSDGHAVFNLPASSTVYYLLFAGDNGYYYDDTIMQAVMSEFLGNTGPEWITLSGPLTGNLASGESANIDVLLDGTNREIGNYTADIRMYSNDPVNAEIVVPVEMNVFDNSSGCQAPTIIEELADTLLFAGDNNLFIDLRSYFADTDSEEIFFSGSANDESVAIVDVAEFILTIKPLSSGSTDVILIARDHFCGFVETSFLVTVDEFCGGSTNQLPVVTVPFETMVTEVDSENIEINLDNHFSDPEGSELTYSVDYDDTMLDLMVHRNILHIAMLNPGNSDITITAEDDRCGTVSATAEMRIEKITGINGLNILETLVYPNPVNDNLQVDFDPTLGYNKMMIISLQGKILLEYNIKESADFKVNTSHLAEGTYMLRLSGYDSSENIRFVVSHN